MEVVKDQLSSSLEIVRTTNGAYPFFKGGGLIGVKGLVVLENKGRAHLSHRAAAMAASFAIHVFPVLFKKNDCPPKHGFGAKNLTNLVGHSSEKAKGATKLCRLA
jgi:hypothetical protein